jgi:hypothetical protein
LQALAMTASLYLVTLSLLVIGDVMGDKGLIGTTGAGCVSNSASHAASGILP